MSVRRSQSSQERSNALAYEPARESAFESASYLPLLSWVSMSAARPNKSSPATKIQLWKKPFFHFFLCFFIGFAIGFTPLSQNQQKQQVKDPLSLQMTAGSKRVAIEEAGSSNSSSSQSQARYRLDVVDPSDPALARKLLLIVTPTYTRAFQAMYLTRLAQTLKLVPPPLLWIVVEMPGQSLDTAALLRKSGVMYRHLVCDKNMTNIKDRGTMQRNVALTHIERHQLDGIVYFADDDNFYGLELFQQLRRIRRFGTWPVAMLAYGKSRTVIEGPVCDGNTVIGWHTNEKSKRLRRFHVDMAGFAFNSTILWDAKRWHRPSTSPIRQLDTVKEGFQETTFIEQLVEDESQMEGLPSGCSKIMVWHLHLEAGPRMSYPANWKMDKYLEPIIHL